VVSPAVAAFAASGAFAAFAPVLLLSLGEFFADDAAEELEAIAAPRPTRTLTEWPSARSTRARSSGSSAHEGHDTIAAATCLPRSASAAVQGCARGRSSASAAAVSGSSTAEVEVVVVVSFVVVIVIGRAGATTAAASAWCCCSPPAAAASGTASRSYLHEKEDAAFVELFSSEEKSSRSTSKSSDGTLGSLDNDDEPASTAVEPAFAIAVAVALSSEFEEEDTNAGAAAVDVVEEDELGEKSAERRWT